MRIRGIGKSFEGLDKTVDQQLKIITPRDVQATEKRHGTSKVYFESGRQDTPIFKLENMDVGDQVKGPALIVDDTQTILVTPEATALILETHVVINIGKEENETG